MPAERAAAARHAVPAAEQRADLALKCWLSTLKGHPTTGSLLPQNEKKEAAAAVRQAAAAAAAAERKANAAAKREKKQRHAAERVSRSTIHGETEHSCMAKADHCTHLMRRGQRLKMRRCA